MSILGKNAKKIRELVMNDKLYYIDPNKPTEIAFLTIKNIEPISGTEKVVKLNYFRASDLLSVDIPTNMIPHNTIICPAHVDNFISHTYPPTIYFTSEEKLKNFMGK